MKIDDSAVVETISLQNRLRCIIDDSLMVEVVSLFFHRKSWSNKLFRHYSSEIIWSRKGWKLVHFGDPLKGFFPPAGALLTMLTLLDLRRCNHLHGYRSSNCNHLHRRVSRSPQFFRQFRRVCWKQRFCWYTSSTQTSGNQRELELQKVNCRFWNNSGDIYLEARNNQHVS